MVSRQQIETLESRLESAMYQIGRARKYLFELVDKHSLDRDNPLWIQQPYDSEGTKFFDVTPQEADAFDAMSEIDRTAWFELQLGKLDVERQQQLAELPNDVRAASPLKRIGRPGLFNNAQVGKQIVPTRINWFDCRPAWFPRRLRGRGISGHSRYRIGRDR